MRNRLTHIETKLMNTTAGRWQRDKLGVWNKHIQTTLHNTEGISLGVQWLGVSLPVQGMWVQSLVEEVPSHMLQGNNPRALKPTHN